MSEEAISLIDIVKAAEEASVQFMQDVCEKVGIPMPKIKWHWDIYVGGRRGMGAYNAESELIIMNFSAVGDLYKKFEGDLLFVLRGVIYAFLHEFAHHMQYKTSGMSLEEWVDYTDKNEKLCEALANLYASSYVDEVLSLALTKLSEMKSKQS